MSRLGWKITLAIAEPITAVIRNGRPAPTLIGAILGGAVGTTAGFAMIELLAPGVLLGAVLGATTGAGFFPRPPKLLGVRGTGEEPDSTGEIIRCWTYEWDQFKSLTVLMDRALYAVRNDKAPWDDVLEKLSSGIDPNQPLGDLIRLDDIDHLELRKPNATELKICYRVSSRTKRRPIDFASVGDRDGFLAALKHQLKSSLVQVEQPIEFSRAILVPLIVLVVFSALTIASMLLSSHWTANPPPPLKTGKQDDLVRLLTWAGPRGILLVAGMPLLLAMAWLLLRTVRPPRIQVLRIGDPAGGVQP